MSRAICAAYQRYAPTLGTVHRIPVRRFYRAEETSIVIVPRTVAGRELQLLPTPHVLAIPRFLMCQTIRHSRLCFVTTAPAAASSPELVTRARGARR